MKQVVSVVIDDSLVVYELCYEMDGIFMATLISSSIYAVTPVFPAKVFIIKTASGWKTDTDHSLLEEHLIRKAATYLHDSA